MGNFGFLSITDRGDFLKGIRTGRGSFVSRMKTGQGREMGKESVQRTEQGIRAGVVIRELNGYYV